MIRLTRRCLKCGQEMPPDHRSKECSYCSGRVVVAVTELPRSGSGMGMPSAPTPGEESEMMRWNRRRKFRPARKLSLDGEALPSRDAPSPEGAGFAVPIVFFALSIATLGLLSGVWIFRMMSILNGVVRSEERVKSSGCVVWAAAYAIGAAMLLVGAAELATSGSGWKLTFAFASVYLGAAFIMSRHYLFWLRSVMAEMTERPDDIAGSCFDVSATALWYVGAAYLKMKLDAAAKQGRIDLRPRDDGEESAPDASGQ